MRSFNERVCQMFGSRFGTQLQIRWSQPVDASQDVEKNWQTTFVYSRTRKQVAFPIFSTKNRLRGIAIASPVDNHDAVRFQEMSDFIELTLVESVRNSDRIASLQDQKVHIWPIPDQPASKVIPLPGTNLDPESAGDTAGAFSDSSFQPLWLHGDHPQINLNVSYAVHEWIQNWAMINVREIPDLFWQKKESWCSYSQMTILIPGVEELEPFQWEILQDNIQQIEQTQGPKPLVILTSQLAPELLKENLEVKFKTFQTHKKVSSKAQAHFLLFRQDEGRRWVQDSGTLQQLFFIPKTEGPDWLH